MQPPNLDHQLNICHKNFVKCTYPTHRPNSCFYTQEDEWSFTKNNRKKTIFPSPAVRRRTVVIPPEISVFFISRSGRDTKH